MKKLFKFIFKLILFVIILAVIIVAGIFIAVTDKTDNAPVKEYDTTVTVQSALSKTLSSSLENLGTTYSMDLLFDEKTLNNLLYAVGKKLNPSYNPGKENPSNDEKYIKSFELPDDIPVVGGKAMGVKSLYGEVDGEEITINVTADVDQKIKTRIHFTFKVETTADSYVLKITEFKFGKINLMMKLALKGIEKFELADTINNVLKDLPFTFAIKDRNYQLTCTKTEFNDYVKSLLNKDGEAKSGDMKTEFVNLLLDPARNMINFGTFGEKVGIKINLDCLKVDADKVVVGEWVKEGFDTNKFIEAQAQSLIINSIYSTDTNKFLSISESDMTKLIYQNMLKDSEIKFETQLMEGVNFKFALEGITFDIDDEARHLLINIIMNINGLKTTAVLTGDIEQTAVINNEVRITLNKNKLLLGKDIQMDSSFLTDILSENFKTSDIMKFENGALVFNADVFNTMIATAMEGKDAKLSVAGIGFVKDNLRIYVDYDSAVADQISTVTNLLKGELEKGIELDTTKFSADDLEKVAEVQDKLDNIKDKFTGSEAITSEDTDALMAAVGEMSAESQEAFYEEVSKDVDPEELQKLYDAMFANK